MPRRISESQEVYRRFSRWSFPVGLLLTVAAVLLRTSHEMTMAATTVLFWLGILLILSGLPLALRGLFPPYGKSRAEKR
jgi:hypothetical protein